MRPGALGGRIAAALCIGLAAFGTRDAPAQTFADPNFTAEVVATLAPFTLVGMAWAPDGRLFIWQKNGVVRVVKNGVLLPTPFLDLSGKVNTFDDRGFWGLAFHPNFASNGYVYVTYVFENAGNPNDPSPRTSRLTRFTANPANPDVALPGSEVVILGSIGNPPCSAYPVGSDCLGVDGGSHTLGEVRFGPDGKMYVGNGDGSDGDSNSLRAQDLGNYSGKILRMNDDGSALSDNPFYDGTNSIRSKVFLYGVRNPFRFSFHPITGDIWFGEVGWNTWEEVNRGTAGANYGWPCYEGNLPQDFFQGNFLQCQQLAPSSVTFPYYTYDHSFGSAAIGGPFYTANLYPAQYRGNFFFADYVGNWIQRVVFDGSGAALGVQSFATNAGAPVTLELGPDGLIYYLSFTTGQVRRIRFNGPLAAASATPTNGYSPLQVSFSSAGSLDPGSGTLTYLWDFGDGATSTQANPTHTYTAATPTVYQVVLTVRNTAGATSSASLMITVGSTPPTPVISAPPDGTSAMPGQTISFQGSATDPDQGALPASALSWTVLLHHNTHVHTFVGGSGFSGSFVAENHGPIGTFSYEIILTATDASGLKASTSVQVAVVADTVPPNAPSGLSGSALGGSQTNLTWTAATDNAAVTGYSIERCAGGGCSSFLQVGTATSTTFVDSGLTPSTSYSYRVRATDASDNLGAYSNTASVTTTSAPPVTGLVAAYAFNEGSGTIVADASGNANTGTLNGATWVAAGRFGAALSFDGSTSRVQVPNSTSLNLSNAMTLEAWIQPSANQSGWRTILQKQTDAYFLNASNSNGPLLPSGGGTFGSNTTFISGSSASPVGTWTHIALTYDGSFSRLYVNGLLANNAAQAGTIQSTGNPLWIGGNSPYGEYFQGLIDEIRIYNRALSQAEIQTDMATPVGPAVPDTVPPSAPSALTATAVSGTQINLAWTASTDNVGVTGYRVERCAGAGCTNFAQVGTPTATTFNDTGLAPSTSYSYRVRATDAAGNLGAYSSAATATTPSAPDTTAPTAPTGLAATAVSTTQITLTWTGSTDNVGVTEYRIERCQGGSCNSFTQVGTSATPGFSSTGLSAGTTYRFRVRAADAAGNLSAYSSIVSAATQAADTTRPSAPSNLVATVIGPNQIDLSWTASTDNVGVTGYRVERCQGSGCTNWVEVGQPSGATFSSTGLSPSTLYRHRLRATDAAGNLSSYSSIVNATTSAVPDTTQPSAPSALTATPAGATQVNLAWTAATDNVAVTGYRVERCAGAGCTNFAQVGTPATTTFNDTGLTASTNYNYRVRATDAAGNLGAYSNIAAATTPTSPPSPGLVAAFGFNEGAGTTVADSSGNGNTGTISGATWTASGRFGAALSFNGSNARVQVPSSASLNLGSAMTLEAWIRPAANQSGWRTIIQKQVDAYFLNASNDTGPLLPSGGGTFGSTVAYVVGATASPVGSWTHVALTYDGAALMLYVNGTLASSQARTGAIQSTGNSLWIGGNSPYGEYFQGLLDEIRVYNRALSAAEIQADMNTPNQ